MHGLDLKQLCCNIFQTIGNKYEELCKLSIERDIVVTNEFAQIWVPSRIHYGVLRKGASAFIKFGTIEGAAKAIDMVNAMVFQKHLGQYAIAEFACRDSFTDPGNSAPVPTKVPGAPAPRLPSDNLVTSGP